VAARDHVRSDRRRGVDVVLLVGWRRDAAGGGHRVASCSCGCWCLASLAGLALGLLVAFVWNGAGPAQASRTCRPAIATGPGCATSLPLARPWLTAVLVAAGIWVAIGRERRPPPSRSLLLVGRDGRGAVCGWLGFPAPLSGPVDRPAHRAAASAAPFLPLAGAAVAETRAPSRPVARLAGALAAAHRSRCAVLRSATLGTPTSVEQLAEVTAAATRGACRGTVRSSW
jgi:hypothetical protein